MIMWTRNPFPLVMWALLMLWFAIVLTGCAGQVNPHAPLFKQIVRMRLGHRGLTHQVCSEKNWIGQCQKMDLIEYDLSSAEIRKQFVELQFICKVGGSRYKIDPDQPRFVRFKRVREWFLAPEKLVVDAQIPITATDRLVNGGTFCYSEKAYPDGLAP